MQRQAEPVPELEAECRHLVREPEIGRLRPHARDPIRAHAGSDQLDGAIEPFAGFSVGIVLRRRGTTDVERAIVAGAITHERLQHVEEGLVAGPDHAVGEIVGVRIAALAGNRVDRLDVVGAVRVEEAVRVCHDVGLARAWFELLEDLLVDAVDHRGRAVEQRDLVDVLDLSRFQHHLLAVDDLEAGRLQLEHHRRLDDVDADRRVGHPAIAQQRGDLLRVALHQPERRRHRAAQPDQARLAVLLEQPRHVEPMVHRGRAEIPQDGLRPAGQQREAAELVALPFADLGRGDVANVVHVEQQQRAEIGVFERLPGASHAIADEAVEIDPQLEIDRHRAPGWQRPLPAVMRVEILGADLDRLAYDLIHGNLPGFRCANGRAGA